MSAPPIILDLSIIVSSSFLRTTYGEPLRRTIKKHAAVLRIVDFGGLAVFVNAKDTYVCIYQYMEKVPIRVINLSNPDDKAVHDRIVSLVEHMLDLHPRLAAARSPDDKTRLEREIKAADGQIDKLVYNLYGLTEEEILIVEGTESK